MKNIINETPNYELKGRLFASTNFVSDNDIKSKNILDIGCGYGWCELNFLKRGAKEIIGMEISNEDLKTIRKNINDSRLKTQVGSAINLPFKDNSFDTVVAWEVLEHIPKKTEKQMFSEVHRVLKKDGRFYFSTPYKSFFSTILDPAWWLIGHRHYTKKQLKYFMKPNFEAIRVRIFGGWWDIFSILNLYISKWIFKRDIFFKQKFIGRNHETYFSNGFTTVFVKLIKI